MADAFTCHSSAVGCCFCGSCGTRRARRWKGLQLKRSIERREATCARLVAYRHDARRCEREGQKGDETSCQPISGFRSQGQRGPVRTLTRNTQSRRAHGLSLSTADSQNAFLREQDAPSRCVRHHKPNEKRAANRGCSRLRFPVPHFLSFFTCFLSRSFCLSVSSLVFFVLIFNSLFVLI